MKYGQANFCGVLCRLFGDVLSGPECSSLSSPSSLGEDESDSSLVRFLLHPKRPFEFPPDEAIDVAVFRKDDELPPELQLIVPKRSSKVKESSAITRSTSFCFNGDRIFSRTFLLCKFGSVSRLTHSLHSVSSSEDESKVSLSSSEALGSLLASDSDAAHSNPLSFSVGYKESLRRADTSCSEFAGSS